MKKNILAFGEILWDLFPDGRVLGGAPFNFIYRIHSLGFDGRIVSRLGEDLLGREALRKIQNLGMNPYLVQIDQTHPTGTVRVLLDENRNPDYDIVPNVAYDFIESAPELLEAAESAECLCFGVLIQRAVQSRETLHRLLQAFPEILKFTDINLRKDCYDEESIRYSLHHADILKLNQNEANILSQMLDLPFESYSDFSRCLCQKMDLSLCIITLEAQGALVSTHQGETFYDAGYSIRLKDAVGSGDAFSAGFLYTCLSGGSVEDSLQFGNLLGALTATRNGGTPDLRLEDVESFQKKSFERIFHAEFV